MRTPRAAPRPSPAVVVEQLGDRRAASARHGFQRLPLRSKPTSRRKCSSAARLATALGPIRRLLLDQAIGHTISRWPRAPSAISSAEGRSRSGPYAVQDLIEEVAWGAAP